MLWILCVKLTVRQLLPASMSSTSSTVAGANSTLSVGIFHTWYILRGIVPDLYLVLSCLTVLCLTALPCVLAHSLISITCDGVNLLSGFKCPSFGMS